MIPEAEKNQSAVALGRLGGLSRSVRKAWSARQNGRRGGWPKGKPRKGPAEQINLPKPEKAEG